jgi:hypothetical protein
MENYVAVIGYDQLVIIRTMLSFQAIVARGAICALHCGLLSIRCHDPSNRFVRAGKQLREIFHLAGFFFVTKEGRRMDPTWDPVDYP